MHSSRKHTIHCSGHLGGGCLPSGRLLESVYLGECLPRGCLPGGVCPEGVSVQGGVCLGEGVCLGVGCLPPPMNIITKNGNYEVILLLCHLKVN